MKVLIKAILILLPFVAIGQNKTYLGAEFGPTFNIYQYADNGDGLYTKPFLYGPIYGVNLEQELNKTFSVETGFYVNNYGESYRIEGDFGYTTSSAILAYQIPIRLKARLNLLKNKLSLITTVGYTFSINDDYESTGTGLGFTTTTGGQFNDSTRTADVSNYGLEKTFGLIETGISLDYKFKNSMRMYLSANYMTGLKRVVEMDVTYRINDEPTQTGTVFSNGDYASVVFGIKYPISNFWSNK